MVVFSLFNSKKQLTIISNQNSLYLCFPNFDDFPFLVLKIYGMSKGLTIDVISKENNRKMSDKNGKLLRNFNSRRKIF